MNHKELAEDCHETALNVDNSGIEARYMARANYHAAMAQLEALEAITALLSPVDEGNSVSLEQLREALTR